MSKNILIGLVVVVVIASASVFYFGRFYRSSPPGKAELTKGELTISISYSRPSVKGRVIFGTQEEGALQPYNTYWRLGANEATEISFNQDVNFNGEPIKAGTYSMYAIPGKETFDIVLNSEINKSGSPEPNHSLDVLHTEVPIQETNIAVEKFTITLQPMGSTTNIIFEWANTRFVVPVGVQG